MNKDNVIVIDGEFRQRKLTLTYIKNGVISFIDMPSQDKKIMVIEDDDDNDDNTNNLIKFFFEKEGYSVDYFTDSTKALNCFKKDNYDLVLIDYKIPKLKELSVYKKIKEIDNKVSICFNNANNETLEEIKRQIPDINNNIIFKTLSIDYQTKLDLLLLKNNDTILILIKP
jgi:CheY-like chemotaxis protein